MKFIKLYDSAGTDRKPESFPFSGNKNNPVGSGINGMPDAGVNKGTAGALKMKTGIPIRINKIIVSQHK